MTKQKKELYSSAFTMSDMEIFIFPDLLYAMVLANIMSPRIWKWKEDPWFKNISKLNLNNKLHRLKQYIMDNYSFNLDLETWGLTTQEKELERFAEYVTPETISKSNALFGYEGDKYYFSIDIRRHFGLDKYDSNIIPYWKTETVEAMDAFMFKPHHKTGAGECVSLSALYTAAMYIVLDIPLEDIFMIATPLHSQSFLSQGEGSITNNRRIVTKKMWFNGSILSEKAQRAIKNEQITYISHVSGHIHYLYETATIDPKKYGQFTDKLTEYLHIPIDGEIFANFLRCHDKYKKYFQFAYIHEGKDCYIHAETLYRYELSSKNRISDGSRSNLLAEVDMEDFDFTADSGRYIFNELENKVKNVKFSCSDKTSIKHWRAELANIDEVENLLNDLKAFSCMQPKLPQIDEKNLVNITRLELKPGLNRENIITYLESVRDNNPVADLAFHAGRYCIDIEWQPFLKAAMERNPVSIDQYKHLSIRAAYEGIKAMSNDSIYDYNQFAQPDEVINYQRGDGLEKAFLLGNIILDKQNNLIEINSNNELIELLSDGNKYTFSSNKNINGNFSIKPGEYGFTKI